MILVQVLLLVAAVTGLLVLVGLGPVVLLGPDLGGTELFLAPFVGLAVMYWATQWLSPHFASGPIVIATCLIGGLFSLVVLWWRRRWVFSRIAAARVDLAIVCGFGVVMAVLLQLPLLHSGVLTINDFSGDDLFTWAPSASYMQTHAYTAGHPTAFISPLLWLLPTNIYPGSAGTVDGGLVTILGVHAYQLVEPISAVCLALGACAVYPLLRNTLGTSRLVAVLGLLFVATNQSRFLSAGFGLAQSTRGTALMMAAVVLFLAAFTERRPGPAVLAGGVLAVLMGVYMPAFLIALAAVLGGAFVVLAPLIRKDHTSVPWRTVVAFTASGLVFGLQNLRWLLFDGGLHAWLLQTHYGRVPLFVMYPLQYLAGTAPAEYLFHLNGVAPFSATHLFWNATWNDVALVFALVGIVLTVTGAVALFVDRHLLIGASFAATLVYGTFVFVDNHGGFGTLLSVVYLVPLLGVLAAYGVQFAAHRIGRIGHARHGTRSPGHWRELTWGATVLSAIAALILVIQAGASAEDEAFFVQQPGMLPPVNLKLSDISSVIPRGAYVLMYAADGSTAGASIQKSQALVAAAGFLPDREITIEGSFFKGRFDRGDGSAITSAYALGYQYVLHYSDPTIHDPPVPSTFHVVWTFAPDHLVLYERNVT